MTLANLKRYRPYQIYLDRIEKGDDLPPHVSPHKIAHVHFGELACRVPRREGGAICYKKFKTPGSLIHHVRNEHGAWTVPPKKTGRSTFEELGVEKDWYDQFYLEVAAGASVQQESRRSPSASVPLLDDRDSTTNNLDMDPPIRRLVMVGACYVDIILDVPHFPLEDHKLRATSLLRRRGGNCPNTLEVLQQFPLDIELVLISVLPSKDSTATKFIQESLRPRVNTSHCIYREDHAEPASCYVISSKESGTRTIVNYNELPEMSFEEFKIQIEGLDDGERTYFHFEGREIDTSSECLSYLRQTYPTSILSIEVENPNRPNLLSKLASQADIVFFSKTWAQAAGFNTPEALLQPPPKELKNAKVMCCTWGAEGATVAVPTSDQVFQSRAVEVETVVDTVGAGDTWTAGFLYMLLSWDGNGDLDERAAEGVKLANKLAGRKVAQQGFGGLGFIVDE